MSEDWTHALCRPLVGQQEVEVEPFLLSSLEHTKRCYERTYNQIKGESDLLTIQCSNLPLPSS
jgi:hypothetical protein